MILSSLKSQFTNLCNSAVVRLAVLNLLFLNLLLNLQFTNLCKSPVFEFVVLKFTVKSSIYKPMQICGFKIYGS